MQYRIGFSTAASSPGKSRSRKSGLYLMARFSPAGKLYEGVYLHMVSQSYDIFRRGAAGDNVWVEAACNLGSAKSRVIELSAERPGQYVVFSQRSGRIVSSGTVVASPAARATAGDLQEPAGLRNGVR